MSAVKGQLREEKDFSKYVGFALVSVVAVNPDREQLNALLGKDGDENDKVIEYVGEDTEGNVKSRVTFWLREEKTSKLFVHNINIIDKLKTNKAGDKQQYINSVGLTTWSDDEGNLQEWFTKFTEKDKTVIGDKSVRKAAVGEEELGIFLHAWLGKLNFNHPDTEVIIDKKKLFAGNYKELKELVGEDFTAPFVVLLGVRTDKDDSSKQYQQVYSKGFLQGNFMKYINNNNSFPTEYAQKAWNKFVENVEGEYGFNAFHKLVPLTIYDRAEDIAAQEQNKPEVTAENADY